MSYARSICQYDLQSDSGAGRWGLSHATHLHLPSNPAANSDRVRKGPTTSSPHIPTFSIPSLSHHPAEPPPETCAKRRPSPSPGLTPAPLPPPPHQHHHPSCRHAASRVPVAPSVYHPAAHLRTQNNKWRVLTSACCCARLGRMQQPLKPMRQRFGYRCLYQRRGFDVEWIASREDALQGKRSAAGTRHVPLNGGGLQCARSD